MARAHAYFAPEVVQTSAMDCGPASLKCLLEGFGVNVSYGRLREACQTDVDGTSIDVMEEVAVKLGLEAEQVMLPLDHLLLAETGALPALLVSRNPDGMPHFVVVWGASAGRVQVMDPGLGRRWMTRRELLDNLYVHSMPIPADGFREWAGSDEFLRGLRQRLSKVGAETEGEALIAQCNEDPTWREASRRSMLRSACSRGSSGPAESTRGGAQGRYSIRSSRAHGSTRRSLRARIWRGTSRPRWPGRSRSPTGPHRPRYPTKRVRRGSAFADACW